MCSSRHNHKERRAVLRLTQPAPKHLSCETDWYESYNVETQEVKLGHILFEGHAIYAQ
jgi:hypothetical protein